MPPSPASMEVIAIIVAGLVGWQNGTLGKREPQIIALVVAGWTAVTTAAQVPYLHLEGLVFEVVAVPCAVGVLANRLACPCTDRSGRPPSPGARGSD